MAQTVAGSSIARVQQAFLRPTTRVAGFTKKPTVARRTVRQWSSNKNGPNWVLDEPKRLWEIGSRYW